MDLLNLNSFLDEGLIAVLFTTLAAIITSIIEKNNKRKKDTTNNQPNLLIEKTFEQIEKMMNDLRFQNEELRDDYKLLKNELEEYRNKYHTQIDIINELESKISQLSVKLQSLQNELGIDK